MSDVNLSEIGLDIMRRATGSGRSDMLETDPYAKHPVEGLGRSKTAARAIIGSCTSCDFAQKVLGAAEQFVGEQGGQALPLLAAGKFVATGQHGAELATLNEDATQKAELLHWLVGNVEACTGCVNQGSCSAMASTVLDLVVKTAEAEQRITSVERRPPVVVKRNYSIVKQRGWLRRIIGL